MRISDWSSDVCCSDRPSIHRTLSRAALGVNGYGWISALTPVHAERTAKRCVSRHARGQREHPGRTVAEDRRADERSIIRRILRAAGVAYPLLVLARRSEEHTSELQSLMRISYAVFCLKK